MISSAVFILAAAAAQGEVGRDLSRLDPVYADPAGFISKEGERIRLGSYMPPPDRLEELLSLGVKLFVSETDRLGPPDAGAGAYSMVNLAAQRSAAEAAGARWGIDLYSSFTTFDESTTVGAGTVEVRSGEKVLAWSPWNPERVRFTANRYGRINRAFENLAFVSTGMFGEFGDASMFSGLMAFAPDLATRWEAALKGEPPKAGFWSGDPLAQESWKRSIEARHGSVAKAYAAWGMTPADAEALPIPLNASYPYVARLEYQDWYRSALPALATSLADIGSNIFKKSPIVIPIGPPNDLPELGLDIFRVADAAKANAAALKVTNLGLYDFPENWAMSLGRIRGASRAAGIPLVAASPFGPPERFSERMFEALALGATALVDAPNAYLSNRRNLAAIDRALVHERPRTDIAILYPSSSHVLTPGRAAPFATYRGAIELRDYTDFDVLEESAVKAGALEPYRVAVVFEGPIWRQETLEAIRRWVVDGGTIVAHDFGKMADPRGNTSVYQDLFGFASSLPRAAPTLRWDGAVPSNYTIDIGSSEDEPFLATGWVDSDGKSRRALPGASLQLPIGEGESVITVTLAKAPATGRVEFRANDRLLAGVGSDGGVKQLQFAVDSASARNSVVTIVATGFDANAELRIDTVEIVGAAGGAAAKLVGRFEAPVAVETVKAWTREHGKGAAIFAPIRQGDREQFLSVVRSAVFSLTKLADGKRDAAKHDNRRDGVYVVDVGDRLVLFNAATEAVEWKPNVEGAAAITLPPKGIRFYERDPVNAPTIVQAEAFATEVAPAAESPVASPGGSLSAVRVGANAPFEVILVAPETRTYRLYARTLRNGLQVPVRFKVGEIEAAPVAAVGSGDVYLVGEFTLEAGENRIQMISDKTFLADFIVATAEPGIIGFKFAPKF
ncbi:MAG: hypothetical protein M3R13_03435 [Armatimonadota bacterium]|nr:hypothetical protein [Armatimonadota bacterium]